MSYRKKGILKNSRRSLSFLVFLQHITSTHAHRKKRKGINKNLREKNNKIIQFHTISSICKIWDAAAAVLMI